MDKWFASSSIGLLSVPVPGNSRIWKLNPPYYTEVEVVLACVWSIRLGFNPGECLDFLLGWGGIDIYNDDLETKKQKTASNKTQKAIGAAAPHPQH